jgi:hypothetical protein
MPSRSSFLIGSAATLAAAGCAGSSSALRPSGVPLAGDFIAAESVRVNLLPQFARSQTAFRRRFAAGSAIYDYGVYVVRDGNDGAVFPQNVTLRRAADGLHVFNPIAGTTSSFSMAATVLRLTDGGEFVVPPGHSLDATLQSLLGSGSARQVGRITTQPPSSHARHGSSEEEDPYGSYDPYYGYQVAANPNDITSFHNQCTTGGENVGVSFTLPSGTSNATITMCINNGTTNVCFYFRGMGAGAHNVSMWIAGSGDINISMGENDAAGNVVKEGIGWADMAGC